MKKSPIIICILFLLLSCQILVSQNHKKFGNDDRKYQELEYRIKELEQKVSFLYNYINNLNNFKKNQAEKYVIKFNKEWYFDPGVITNINDLEREQNRFRDSYGNRLDEIKHEFSLTFLKIDDCYTLNPLDEEVGKGLLIVIRKEYYTWFLKERKNQQESFQNTKVCFEGTLGFFDSKIEALEFINKQLPVDLNYFVEELK